MKKRHFGSVIEQYLPYIIPCAEKRSRDNTQMYKIIPLIRTNMQDSDNIRCYAFFLLLIPVPAIAITAPAAAMAAAVSIVVFTLVTSNI